MLKSWRGSRGSCKKSKNAPTGQKEIDSKNNDALRQQRESASKNDSAPTRQKETDKKNNDAPKQNDGEPTRQSSKPNTPRSTNTSLPGSITNPRHKWCPTNLKPWPDFLQQQRIVFGTLYDTFPSDRRCFESRSFLSGLGSRIARRKITDEKALEYFLHNSVEDPVRAIMDELKEVEEVKSAFDLGNGIVFENHPHAISDAAEEVVDRNVPSTPPSTPHTSNVDLKQLRADQICVYRSETADSESRTMLYVSEYKPPHKLTAPHLRLGLRPMNIYKEVVNRKTIPTSVDPDARFQYHAERLTAAAITQTYHYMIEGGLEHGLLTTGEAIVFLKIDWREPETLFYHLAEPSAEAEAHPEHAHLCTAVAQYLAFSLIALSMPGERSPHGQDERREAMDKLRTWAEDFETTLRRKLSDDCHHNRNGGGRADTCHLIDHTGFMKLLGEQLERTLDDGVTPLGRGGARGVLFRVSLLAYGYTFVSKGTVRAFIKDLQHEAAVYKRLRPIQGKHVPVYLGAIDLRPMNRTYYYDHRVYVVHMTFLSWGGHDLYAIENVDGGGGHLEEMAMQSLRAIHCQGVVHRDMREDNMLFNEEVKGVLIIDFERAQLLTPPRRPLTQLVPNKRRRVPEVVNGNKLAVKSRSRDEGNGVFLGDIAMVKEILG
ncbi:hypothetical protein CkaCkLH20_03662 [Colletotrichum karsti]|uniref:EKC/KEOPS complex subunit BUD32 n=1 Tax=Colletotrichum karsti TaxID=1095194 RepID=A0A9P6LNP7_9PEZI|nr:uncharacterized protein CkaCkLH20_03662 [Colletotrichum karsti]KAF9878762.1 hypothetical protein CkaCkLH20_03662 [Colletotrichum karsti]